MKTKKFSVLAILLLSIALMVSACGKSNNEPKESNKADSEAINAVLFINGTLGDKSFYDSANLGIQRAVNELGITAKTVEGGNNQADWAASLESLVASNKYNVVVLGTSQMADITRDLANRYPDIKFIFFDDVLTDGIPNIYSMLYSQSEGAFLAGAFGALVTTNTELTAANPEKAIGFVGGMDIPIINDFKSGFEQGAKYVDPEVKVITSYVGDFSNAPKAKELTLAQINSQKVDIVFNVASGAGIGILEGANESGVYSIGVDSNQNPLYPGSVLTSMLKNVDQSIFRAFDLMIKGELKFGSYEVLGIAEGGISLAKDELFQQHVPNSIKEALSKIEVEVTMGNIQVESSL